MLHSSTLQFLSKWCTCEGWSERRTCFIYCRTSPPPGWTPKLGASCGTASWASSKRDAPWSSRHTGAASLTQPAPMARLNIWTPHQGETQKAKCLQINGSHKYCNYNWLELHLDERFFFPEWQLLSAARNTSAAIKLSWGHIDGLVLLFFFWFCLILSSLKGETINISAEVFSLSKTSGKINLSFPSFFLFFVCVGLQCTAK